MHCTSVFSEVFGVGLLVESQVVLLIEIQETSLWRASTTDPLPKAHHQSWLPVARCVQLLRILNADPALMT